MPRGFMSPVWYDLPGVVAAYQFVGSPTITHAYRNVNTVRASINALTAGVAPSHSYLGLYFNGSTQYLDTGLLANWNEGRGRYDTSIIVRWAFASYPNINHRAVGAHYDPNQAFGAGKYYNGAAFNAQASGLGSTLATATIGVDASGAYYWNGAYIATAATASQGNSTQTLLIGASNNNAGAADHFWSGYIQAVLIANRYMTSGEFMMASHQMAFCEHNPAWNAWAPKRRYYYGALQAGAGRARINAGLVDHGLVNGGLMQ